MVDTAYRNPLFTARQPQKILFGEIRVPDTLEFMTSHAGNGDIVHAGTYFGDFLPALSYACTDSAKIWTFKPNPENYRCARIMIEINNFDNVVLMNAGLGMQKDRMSLKVSDEHGRALGGLSRPVNESHEFSGNKSLK